MNNRNISTISIIIVFISLLLCGYTSVGEFSRVRMTINEDYDDGYTEFNTLQIEGKYITLPCKVQLLIDLGFTPEKEIYVNSGYIVTSVWFTNDDGSKLTCTLYNNSSAEKKLSEIEIYEIEYEFGNKQNKELDFNIKGLKLHDISSTASSIFGEPSYRSEVYNGSLSKYFETPAGDRTVIADFDMSDNCCRLKAMVEMPEHKGYQGLYSSVDLYNIEDDAYTYYTQGEESKQSSFESIIIIFFILVAMVAVVIAPFIIVAVVVLKVIKHMREVKEELAINRSLQKQEEMRLAQKILNTDLEDLTDEIDKEANLH